MGTINVDTIKNNVGGNTGIKIGDASLSSSSGNLGLGVTPTTAYGRVAQIHDTGTAGANLRLTDANSGSGTGNGFEIIQLTGNSFLINREAGAMSMFTSGTEAMKIDANGHITKPLQPAFLVTKSGAQDNLTAGSEITITFDSEIFDQNADFASNTFTAPVDGRYYLQIKLNLGSTDADSSNFQTRIITSNRTHAFNFDPAAFDQDTGNHTVMAATLADMDANDTCTFKVFQTGGLNQCDVSSSSTASGFLAC